MKLALLTDFGSTRTKVTAVDLDAARLVGRADAATTREDINLGHQAALKLLALDMKQRGLVPMAKDLPSFDLQRACSSAAGGLRMVVCGLIPELTAAAARQAALGAGAKVIAVKCGELTKQDLDELRETQPDILLLTGGTDGGNRQVITTNARRLAQLEPFCPLLYAGNRAALDDCVELLETGGWSVSTAANVLPSLEQMDTAPAQAEIRRLFLERIIQAKGLSRVQAALDGILMPTPSAVLAALTLLADGGGAENGIGELLAFDVGGATTDVYSIAAGTPRQAATVQKGLPPPRVQRSVEGDIGLFYSAAGISEAAGVEEIAALAGLDEPTVRSGLAAISTGQQHEKEPDQYELTWALTALALRIAGQRHAGRLESVYTPMGETWLQTGKDLRQVRHIVLTGGTLSRYQSAQALLPQVLWHQEQAGILLPDGQSGLTLWRDRSYILAAMGLLAADYPAIALNILRQELQSVPLAAELYRTESGVTNE